jgi:CMP/dCMP kinase
MTMERSRLRIAVDGPAASGKGTVARNVARALGYTYVDTGSFYRSVALVAAERGVPWDDEEALARLARTLLLQLSWDGDKVRVLAGGRDVSEAIRSEQVGVGASRIAALPSVRAALFAQQRALGAAGGVVMDGRDIATVILPDAELKAYLDASVDERVRRRWAELRERGAPRPLEEVREEILGRDRLDHERATAPLRRLPESFYVDTTGLSIDEATALVLAEARRRGA